MDFFFHKALGTLYSIYVWPLDVPRGLQVYAFEIAGFIWNGRFNQSNQLYSQHNVSNNIASVVLLHM